jgi:uncharacterized protein YcbK (DUF882 family)
MSFPPAALAATASKAKKTGQAKKAAQKPAKTSSKTRRPTRVSTRTRTRTRTRANPAKPEPFQWTERRVAIGSPSEKTLSLVVPQTGEKLIHVPFWANGSYLPDAMAEIAHLMRDMRSGDIRPVDPALLDLLYDLGQTMETDSPIQVVCGYRSPATNAYLRTRSSRVARESLHMHGKAMDIRLDRGAHNVYRAALALERGGVGYYPRSGFVHVDTGPVRTWRG